MWGASLALEHRDVLWDESGSLMSIQEVGALEDGSRRNVVGRRRDQRALRVWRSVYGDGDLYSPVFPATVIVFGNDTGENDHIRLSSNELNTFQA